MEIIGRITKHAVFRTVKKNNRSVISFTIAIDDYYKPKMQKGIRAKTYIDYSYWLNATAAKYLVQGALIEVHGPIYSIVYMSKNNEPKANMNCHVNSFKIHATMQREKVSDENAVEEKSDFLF